jgi:hypothetical protein
VAIQRPIKFVTMSPATTVLPGQVILYDQTWTVHIEPRHTDVQLNDITNAMVDPCEIYTSRTTPGSLVLVNTRAMNTVGQTLRVPVKPLADGTNVVTSAYYGNDPHGQLKVWTRGT